MMYHKAKVELSKIFKSVINVALITGILVPPAHASNSYENSLDNPFYRHEPSYYNAYLTEEVGKKLKMSQNYKLRSLECEQEAEDLLRYRFKSDKPIIFDYSASKVSDIVNHPSLRNITDVLQEIGASLKDRIHKPINISLKDNYLTDNGIEIISDFILNNSFINNNLAQLDLSNNRFTEKSLPKLKNVLDNCPNLNLDIAINYIGFNDFAKVFGDPSVRKRIRFSVY